jgi:hypothetical protein
MTDQLAVQAAATDGRLLVVAVREENGCGWLEYSWIDETSTGGGPYNPYPQESCAAPDVIDMRLAADGSVLYVLSGDDPTRLEGRDLTTGDSVFQYDLPVTRQLSLAPGGTLAMFGEDKLLVGRLEGGRFELRPEEPDPTGLPVAVAVYDGDLTLAPGATLGSGTGQLPCTPLVGAPYPDLAALPGPVARTATSVAAAAAECDFPAILELMAANPDFSGSFAYAGRDGSDFFIHSWIAESRRGSDVLNQIARIMTTRPALAEDGSYYVWPAVFATGADVDWEDLANVLTPEELEVAGAPAYLGWRVGIARDGTWMFAVAGD